MVNQQVIVQGNIKTERSLLKVILLSMITCGIYGLVVMCEMANSINVIAGKYDGKKTMHLLLAMLLGCVTVGIYPIVWMHKYTNRIGAELNRRGIDYKFNASTFWLWGVLGSYIIVGPCVFLYKQLTAMNKLSADYNQKG